jgi:2-keto-4-pentenoate hydratase/2-oxohepta-3-ene-1,7-dioic acid hydratase in catechol pathway
MQEIKLCLYDIGDGDRVGSVVGDRVYDLNLCCARQLADEKGSADPYRLANSMVPQDLGGILGGGDRVLADTRHALEWVLDNDSQEGPSGEPLSYALKDIKLKAPILPTTKVICMGGVFPTHLQIAGVDPHEFPMEFYKMSQVVVGPDEWVIIPKSHQTPVVGGSELTAVFGKTGRSFSEDQADDHIWGYTVLNDVTLRGIPTPTHKIFESSAPVGPWIVPKDQIADPQNLKLIMRINGEQVQEGSTSSMLASIHAMAAHCSKWMTLIPGDILATGDLGSTDPIKPGDIMEVEVEGVGVLRNPVKLED